MSQNDLVLSQSGVGRSEKLREWSGCALEIRRVHGLRVGRKELLSPWTFDESDRRGCWENGDFSEAESTGQREKYF